MSNIGLNMELKSFIPKILLSIVVCLGIVACDYGNTGGSGEKDAESGVKTFTSSDYKFPYDLKNAVQVVKFENKLKEISGLAWVGENLLACVQDEKGNIYLVDPRDNNIVEKIDFAGQGDYEGVAKVGEDYWVLRSDGRLYEVKGADKIKKYDTDLDEDFDVEGLCYQADKNRLLLACKGYPGRKYAGRKTVYAFDLGKKELIRKPAYIISLKKLEKVVGTNIVRDGIGKVGDYFNPGKGNTTFQPSGIEVHPLSGNIYVIGHVGKLLVVLSPKGNILHIGHLDWKNLPQPEGITFAPDGRMYISSEGVGGKARMAEYKPLR